MRYLVACPACKRQYDASDMEVGSAFHCLCGARVKVAPLKARDAAVVRCSWCGAPRAEGAGACTFCGAEFTLREKDLQTICPVCMARVSDRARFCHDCGTPIVPENQATGDTVYACPVCAEGRHLRSRRLGDTAMSVLECQGCAGLWIAAATLETIVDVARKSSLPAKTQGGTSVPERDYRRGSQAPQAGPMYRKCITCGKIMNRVNYARQSAVIIDLCKDHGVWFDADELERLVQWVRRGGLALADEALHVEEKERKKKEAAAKAELAAMKWEEGYPRNVGIYGLAADVASDILTSFFGIK